MKPTPNLYPSASKGEFHEPPPKPNLSSGGELHPSLKAMVREQPFSGHDHENPCRDLREFKVMCSCLSISVMTQETLRWKLFPFSLMEKVKQWYTHAIESTNGDWDELRTSFVLHFSPMSHIVSLPKVILDFQQCEKESIGVAWPRFLVLIHAGPDLSLPQQHFAVSLLFGY